MENSDNDKRFRLFKFPFFLFKSLFVYKFYKKNIKTNILDSEQWRIQPMHCLRYMNI